MPAAQSTVPANVIWGDLILPDTTPAQRLTATWVSCLTALW